MTLITIVVVVGLVRDEGRPPALARDGPSPREQRADVLGDAGPRGGRCRATATASRPASRDSARRPRPLGVRPAGST